MSRDQLQTNTRAAQHCHQTIACTAGTYAYSLSYGGPVLAIWGWVFVSFMNLLVALVLAEICSSFPTSGGVYFYAHRLAGGRCRLRLRLVMLAWLVRI